MSEADYYVQTWGEYCWRWDDGEWFGTAESALSEALELSGAGWQVRVVKREVVETVVTGGEV